MIEKGERKKKLHNGKMLFFLFCVIAIGVCFSIIFLHLVSDRGKGFISEGDIAETRAGKTYHSSYRSDPELYSRIYSAVQDDKALAGAAYGGIVPHHFLAASLIAKFYKKMEAQEEIQTVILVGPNHFKVGFGEALVSEAYWQTPFGDVDPDTEMINDLVQAGLVKVDENPFIIEHSISTHMPFIRHTFPEAKVVPLILKEDIGYDRLDRIAGEIYEKSGGKVLMISSVDFSHYQSRNGAEVQDAESVAAITSFRMEDISQIDVDSPASIYLLLRFLQRSGAQKSLFAERSNSAILSDQEGADSDTVGYFIGHFGK